MTAEALLESVLNYPLIGDAFVFNTFQTGVDNLATNFAAFKALINRDDLAKILVTKYSILTTENISDKSIITKGEHAVKLCFLELLFAQGFVNNKLTKSQSLSLLKTLIDIYAEKTKYPDIYGGMSFSTSAWAINKILLFTKSGELFTVTSKLAEDGTIFSPDILSEILQKAKNYIETSN